jgi:hypothetical protein
VTLVLHLIRQSEYPPSQPPTGRSLVCRTTVLSADPRVLTEYFTQQVKPQHLMGTRVSVIQSRKGLMVLIQMSLPALGQPQEQLLLAWEILHPRSLYPTVSSMRRRRVFFVFCFRSELSCHMPRLAFKKRKTSTTTLSQDESHKRTKSAAVDDARWRVDDPRWGGGSAPP